MAQPQTEIDPTPLFLFEDTIDGYFPLRISLSQMMERLGTALAYVQIEHAPILEVPGLAPDAPVPLNIRSGRAGLIDTLDLKVEQTENGTQISGLGQWRWLDGQENAVLDPMTRLAEPAFLHGCVSTPPMGATKAIQTSSARRVFATRQSAPTGKPAARRSGEHPQRLWGPFLNTGEISHRVHHRSECNRPDAEYVLLESG